MIDLAGWILQRRLAQLALDRHQAALAQTTEAEEEDASSPEAEDDPAEVLESDPPSSI
jgi:hypothetical protein